MTAKTYTASVRKQYRNPRTVPIPGIRTIVFEYQKGLDTHLLMFYAQYIFLVQVIA